MRRYFLLAFLGFGLTFPLDPTLQPHWGALLLWLIGLACLMTTYFLVDKHHRLTVSLFSKTLAGSLIALLQAEGKESIAAGQTTNATE